MLERGEIVYMDIKYIFEPSSIALIGASDKKSSIGNAIMHNIINNGFKGKIYPVNPSCKSVFGKECFNSILDIDEYIELAIIVTPSRTLPSIMNECAEKGVNASIIISAGFREVGEEGRALEEEVKSIAKKNNIRIIGPNCIGIINTETFLNTTFIRYMPRHGNISLISQSGAICGAILEYAKDRIIGFSKVISLGNKLDVNENDALETFINDSSTKVIIVYLEDLVEPKRFIELSNKSTKPIIVMKVGRSTIGMDVTRSHTGALAGSEEMYNAIFEDAKVLRVDTLEELFDAAIAFASQPLPEEGCAILSNAGGAAVIAADSSHDYNISLAKFDKDTLNKLRSFLPKIASISNPLDITGSADHLAYDKALATILNDNNVKSCIVMAIPHALLDTTLVAKSIIRVSKEFKKTILACILSNTDIESKLLEENGIPCYKFPESAVKVLSSMLRYSSIRRLQKGEVKIFTDVDRTSVANILSVKKGHIHHINALRLLAYYGFNIARFGIANNEDDAIKISDELGYPVVLKIVSEDIIHKYDLDAVKIANDANDVIKGFRDIMVNIREKRPDARIEGISIQEFVKGKEVIIGLKHEQDSLIMFGSGGIYVDVLKDLAYRLVPIDERKAYSMINSTKIGKILQGVRGEKPYDISAVIESLERLSQLSVEFKEIKELDINPLIVSKKGCKVVDARIII
ncbi:MAG: acetate--CoA ligase family protein [Candidatus Nitrosocaldaceae archaeon]